MPKNWEQRERKVERRAKGHVVDNRGIFVMKEAQEKRDDKAIKRYRREFDGDEEQS
jgi:hypothetical protein